MLFIAFYNIHKVHVCAAQFISQLDTPSSLPAHSLELLLSLFLTFGKSFHLLPDSIQDTVADLYSCQSPHMKGLQLLNSCTVSARPGRKANTPTTVKKNMFFTSSYNRKKPFSHTCTTNILFLIHHC